MPALAEFCTCGRLHFILVPRQAIRQAADPEERALDALRDGELLQVLREIAATADDVLVIDGRLSPTLTCPACGDDSLSVADVAQAIA